MAHNRNRSGLRRTIIGIVLFGVAFGYVEAAVVVYLRAMYDPLRHQLHPERSLGELFPLIRLDELQQIDRPAADSASRYERTLTSHLHRLKTELGRELATLVLLAGVALLAAKSFNEWIAVFMITFGIWDIFYYIFLKVLIDWPASLMTWDILFLLPVPWAGPVLTPVIVAASMIVAGILVLTRERRGNPVAFTIHWVLMIAGGVLIVCSFCWDYRNLATGGYPVSFQWPIYLAGLLLGIAAFIHAYLRQPAAPITAAQGQ